MFFKSLRSMVIVVIGTLISMASNALPSADKDMRAYSISCLGGRGYSLRHSHASVSTGVLGAFLKSAKSDAIAVEIQKRFIGNRGVDDEETELIGLELSGRFDFLVGQGLEFSPERVEFALSDAAGAVGGAWKANAKLSRLVTTRLSDGAILLGGSIFVTNAEHPNEGAATVKVSCFIPSY